MPKSNINSFNSGELSPYIYARSDLEKYRSGCLTVENFLPLQYGGVERRPAIKFDGESKQDDQIRMIPFKASVENSFHLEFGTQYIRVWKDGQRVYSGELDIVESGTYQWTASGSGTNEYYLELSGGGNPSITEPDYVTENGVELPADTIGSLKVGSWVWGDNDTLGYDTVYIRLTDEVDPDTKADGYLQSLIALEIGTPYTDTELNGLKYASSIDVMWIVHPDHEPRRLSRISNTSWTMIDEQFDYPPLLDENTSSIAMSPSAADGEITLTSSSDFFDAGHVGSHMAFKAIRNNDNDSLSGNFTANGFSDEINASNSNWTVSTTGTWRGKLVLLRSLNGGPFENYVQIGDTLAAASGGEKNFSFTSEAPEPSGTVLKLQFIDNSGTCSYELDLENVYHEALVKITGYTDAQNVIAEVISPFQDVPSDYVEYSTLSGTITVGTKAYINSKLEYTSTSVDLTSIDSGLTDIVGAEYGINSFWFVTNGASNKKIYQVNSSLTTLLASYDISGTFVHVQDIAIYANELYIAGNFDGSPSNPDFKTSFTIKYSTLR